MPSRLDGLAERAARLRALSPLRRERRQRGGAHRPTKAPRARRRDAADGGRSPSRGHRRTGARPEQRSRVHGVRHGNRHRPCTLALGRTAPRERHADLVSNIGLEMGAEKSWPFSASEALSWIPCEEFAKPPRGGCGKAVDAGRSRLVATDIVGEFTEIEYLAAPAESAVLEAKLAVLSRPQQLGALVGRRGLCVDPREDARRMGSTGRRRGRGARRTSRRQPTQALTRRNDARGEPRPRQPPGHVHPALPRRQSAPRRRMSRGGSMPVQLRKPHGRVRTCGSHSGGKRPQHRSRVDVRTGRLHLPPAAGDRSGMHRLALQGIVSRS